MPTIQDLRAISDVRNVRLTLAELHVNGGLIEDWENVARHDATTAFAANELAHLLGLPRGSRETLTVVGAFHDARKRIDRFPDHFSDKARAEFERCWQILLKDFDRKNELMAALDPKFHLIVHRGKATFLQLVIWYADDICRGDEIVRFKERIDEVEARNPHPDPEVAAALDVPSYWDAERALGELVEQSFYWIMKALGVEIESPEAIPDLVRQRVDERLVAATA